MIAVIFEVRPKPEQKDTYLSLAAELYKNLVDIKGFISIERFTSLNEPNKILSLSLWENEQAIQQWRQQSDHQAAQHKGKHELFEYYRIQVADIKRTHSLSSDNTANDERC